MDSRLFRYIKRQVYIYTSDINPKNKPLKVNTELKRIRTSDKAYILATGPSVNKLDLKQLEGQDCFSVSNFFLHKDIEIIKPKLHFFAAYHPPLILENFIDWLKAADKALPPETNIVMSISNKYIVDENRLFCKRKVYYIDQVVSERIRTDITKPVTAAQTGPLMTFPVVDYLGYEQINLIGCDMNTLKNYRQNVDNFYRQDQDPRKNSTDKNTWCDGIIYNLECALNAVNQFKNYDEYFIRKGKKLYNLSDESW